MKSFHMLLNIVTILNFGMEQLCNIVGLLVQVSLTVFSVPSFKKDQSMLKDDPFTIKPFVAKKSSKSENIPYPYLGTNFLSFPWHENYCWIICVFVSFVTLILSAMMQVFHRFRLPNVFGYCLHCNEWYCVIVLLCILARCWLMVMHWYGVMFVFMHW